MYLLMQNMFKWIRRQKVYYIEYFRNDVAICLCAKAEERRAFTLAHFQAVGDHDSDVINGVYRSEKGEDITEVPCILVTNGHVTESIFDVKFGK